VALDDLKLFFRQLPLLVQDPNGMLNFITVDSWASFLSLYPSYFIAGLLLPFVYGSWRFTVYHFLVEPQLAMLLTSKPNELAAIWCLLSIGILLLVVKTPIRRFMFVKSFWLWPRKIDRKRSGV